ncbi:hypothetical protein HDEF_0663 [Candidatus Hamiltonella defensa 5AT (Acyrthosiphon pisum)]|uniref:Uncharacterized protein n=1 Tax=Hamiltonella defensa subsp. Acyrthosiphon pisum (strain 5AT) TaxID=572265 RepID=C4K4B0_HAMD5|nr:hypothetical protein HDEF_0663 [Candidatus Hamiltonella defensa 5AT (Acyrthosiphon pisum)]
MKFNYFYSIFNILNVKITFLVDKFIFLSFRMNLILGIRTE